MQSAGRRRAEQTLGVPYLFEFRGRTSYLGLTFDADAPPFELPIDEALLTFSGGTLSGSFAGRRLDADAQIGSVDSRRRRGRSPSAGCKRPRTTSCAPST